MSAMVSAEASAPAPASAASVIAESAATTESRNGVRDSNNNNSSNNNKNDLREDSSRSRGSSSSKAAPLSQSLSLEELLRRKAEEKAAVVKPVFLTKEERARIALERRQQEVAAQRSSTAASNSAAIAAFSLSRSDPSDPSDSKRSLASRDSRDSRNPRDSRDSRDSGDSRDRKRVRDEAPTSTTKDGQPPTDQSGSSHIDARELKAIRDRYMGGYQKKRSLRRINDKKFVFDWDNQEDTANDFNPIYTNKHSAQLFGRGLIAGIDVKTQKKQRASFYENVLRERRTSDQVERESERIEQERIKERSTAFDERHWSEKPLEEMKERDWRIFKEDFLISTKGGNIPNPIRNWSESSLPPSIKDLIQRVGYTEPTPIQRQAIPIGLQNRDIIGIAETGSGKTASFVIPMLVYISDLPPMVGEAIQRGPYALILAPTRELALQIEIETSKFASEMGYRCVSIVGGHDIDDQVAKLRNGVHIIIATPGRLRDLLDRSIVVLSQCTYVVMDEADRMVDLGFEQDINDILNAMPVSNIKPDLDPADEAQSQQHEQQMEYQALASAKKFRQTVMFSATMLPAVERIANKFLRRPATVTIGVAGQAVDRIEQRVEMINDESRKLARLKELVNQFPPPIMVFVNQKKGCEVLCRALELVGLRCAPLHGGRTQEQRESALAALRQGTKDILIATDVAGRGIDVKNVSLVVNYDMAKNIEDYTHRIGRTGRAGKTGVAVTFLSSSDTDVMYDLRQMLIKSSISRVPPELARHEAAQTKPSVARAAAKKGGEY
eukprot:jgi/Hompol1/4767/HPOL_003865-RA